ncbi:helix-turn-helix transcriptional regulator [Spirillospora sp. NPDC047279]|uniref:helix-turn-helix domain-containing protein n=1 Tax=Spirillospora sp. NPDC047279 TaxID=3155478 RepID=UPI0033CF10DD
MNAEAGPAWEALRGRGLDELATAMGEEAFAAARARGAALSDAEAIRVVRGEPSRAATASAPGERSPLTKRELQVAGLVAQGLSNRQIAERLVISKRTADSHLEHILAKLGFISRPQIAAWAALADRTDPDA